MSVPLPRHRRDGLRVSATSLAIAASLGVQLAWTASPPAAQATHHAVHHAAARSASAAPAETTVSVTTCADSGAGSVRDAFSHAVTGEVIDLGSLTCSRITLTTGALVDPASATDVTLHGPGRDRLAIDGNAADRVLIHRGAGDLHVDGLSIANGLYSGVRGYGGGCIYSLGGVELWDSRVSGCVLSFSGDYSALGGGIYAKGTVRLFSSVIADNHASAGNVSAGGGVAAAGLILANSTVSGNTAQKGAGLFMSDAVNEMLDIEYSTISDNGAHYGGGLFVFGSPRTHLIENSTFSGNAAAYGGGGIYSYSPLDIYNSTIASNSADHPFNESAGIVMRGLHSQDVAHLESTIVANNTTGDGLIESDLDVSGGMLVGSNNLVMNFSAESQPFLNLSGTISIEPMLGPLEDNGGPAPTHALLPGSPAIDRGGNPLQLASDQRGVPFARMEGAGVDIGAYEYSDRLFRNGFELE